jgi:methanethiol S-methyltransferase
MQRLAILVYGIGVYVVFTGTVLYAMGFVTGIVVPRTLDKAPPPVENWVGWLIDLGMLSLFALQHTVMARTNFKQRLTKIIPAAAERSTYVLMTCLILILIFWQWREIPGVIWSTDNPIAVRTIIGVSFLGWGIVFLATVLINNFELNGLSQVWRQFRGTAPAPKRFVTPLLYKYVRHPLYVGFFIAFMATPQMTAGHLLFAVVATAYVVLDVIFFEEPSLVSEFPDEYSKYQQRVRMFLPLPKRKKHAAQSTTSSES